MALFILRHPASTQDAKNHAEHLRLELESKLTQEELKAMQTRKQPDTFEAFISLQNSEE